MALLGEELVAEAGGLPEAAAELGAALKTSQLVACVADGAIGPWDCLGWLSCFRSWGFLGWHLVSEDFWLGTGWNLEVGASQHQWLSSGVLVVL